MAKEGFMEELCLTVGPEGKGTIERGRDIGKAEDRVRGIGWL